MKAQCAKTGHRPPLFPFKVFIGYADLTALRHATTAIADAVRVSRHRVETIPLLWRFGQLAAPHWRDAAMSAALEADAVVLACTGHHFDPEIEAWVDSLLTACRGLPVTVVAVFGEADAWTITLAASRTSSARC
jgi:hypothetical protein